MKLRRHNVASPSEIRLADWRAILLRTGERIMADNLGVLAGGVAFYGFLSVFPAIAGALMVWGLFGGPASGSHIDVLRDLAPGPAFDLIVAQMSRIADQGARELTLGLIVTVLIAFWSASRGVVALMTAMNMAY